jgi:hypothetical protein
MSVFENRLKIQDGVVSIEGRAVGQVYSYQLDTAASPMNPLGNLSTLTISMVPPPVKRHTFSEALEYIRDQNAKSGREPRAWRKAWGSGMWIVLQPDSPMSKGLPYIALHTQGGKNSPWAAPHLDLLADDWELD